MTYGYRDRIAYVDLSERAVRVEPAGDLFWRTYLGGRGLATRVLLLGQDAGVDPYGPGNQLVFATGVLTGVPIPTFSRFTVACKSPLTGGYGEGEAGGYFGPELKFAGLDALVIRGVADSPVYLFVGRDGVEIRDARHLWGLPVGDTVREIRRELGDERVRVAAIGPAGERLVRFACVLDEAKHAAGRTGTGAVMGAKKLKAVAVRGTRPLPVANTDKVKEIARWFVERHAELPATRTLHDVGTSGTVGALNAAGMLPTRHFSRGTFEGWESIDGVRLRDEFLVARRGCYACPVRCKRVVGSCGSWGSYDPIYGGPEYETIAAFGSNCGVDDLGAVIKAHEICNAYGMDTISAGVAVSFSMACFEAGILTERDAGGLRLRFGNAEAMLAMLKLIGEREGMGNVLAEGTVRASEAIGGGSDQFLAHVKGQEIPMHDPRGKFNVGLGYAVSEIGADHMVAPHDPLFARAGQAGLAAVSCLGVLEPLDPLSLEPSKVRLFVYLEDLWSLLKCAGVCFFGVEPRGIMPLRRFEEAVSAVTGWDTSLFELLKAGERAVNMARAYDCREGILAGHDRLPTLLHRPLPDGPLAGRAIGVHELRRAVEIHHEMRGWDPATGRPRPGKLHELGLGWLEDL